MYMFVLLSQNLIVYCVCALVYVLAYIIMYTCTPYVCMCVRMYVHVCAYLHVFKCVHVYVHVCQCVYVYLYVCDAL